MLDLHIRKSSFVDVELELKSISPLHLIFFAILFIYLFIMDLKREG